MVNIVGIPDAIVDTDKIRNRREKVRLKNMLRHQTFHMVFNFIVLFFIGHFFIVKDLHECFTANQFLNF